MQPFPAAVTDLLAWLVVGAFLAGALAELRDRALARRTSAVAWALFGVFWLAVFPTFLFEMRSPIESVLSLVAVPLSFYTGYLLWRGRDSLLVLSRAVAVMGLIYLPAETIPFVRQFLIEQVAAQTYAVIGALGYEVALEEGPAYGYMSALVFTDGTGHRYLTYIELACTGIGSISIFGGLIAAVRAPLRRKLGALSVAVVVIYGLNIVRNVFIAVAFGRQWFHVYPDLVLSLTGYERPGLVSFFIADRVISQSLSVVALVGVTYLVVRQLPELLAVIEDVLFVVTGNEYDLGGTLGAPVRADGGER